MGTTSGKQLLQGQKPPCAHHTRQLEVCVCVCDKDQFIKTQQAEFK